MAEELEMNLIIICAKISYVLKSNESNAFNVIVHSNYRNELIEHYYTGEVKQIKFTRNYKFYDGGINDHDRKVVAKILGTTESDLPHCSVDNLTNLTCELLVIEKEGVFREVLKKGIEPKVVTINRQEYWSNNVEGKHYPTIGLIHMKLEVPCAMLLKLLE